MRALEVPSWHWRCQDAVLCKHYVPEGVHRGLEAPCEDIAVLCCVNNVPERVHGGLEVPCEEIGDVQCPVAVLCK